MAGGGGGGGGVLEGRGSCLKEGPLRVGVEIISNHEFWTKVKLALPGVKTSS